MPIAGAAAGAARSLEELVATQLLKQQLEEEIAQRDRQFGMEQDRFRETQRNNAFDRDRTVKIDEQNATERQRVTDARDTERRGRSNMAGVIGMGLDPETASREVVMSSLQSGADIPSGVAKLLEPQPEEQTYAVTVAGPNGRPMRTLKKKSELAQGVEEYREPRAPSAPQRDPIADYRARKEIDKEFGAANSVSNPVEEAADTAREARRLALKLKDHPGLGGAFGVFDARMPTLKQDTADAEVLRDALTSLLTLENTGKLKGVLSNADMQILKQASTTIAAPMSDAAARAELARVAEVMGRATGESAMPSMEMSTSRGGGAPADPTAAAMALIEKARAARKPQ